MEFDSTYDGIILGSGHNGLVLQAYLSRAGLKVLCLERNDVAGGGLRTEQLPEGSGFHHNTHSFYHRALTRMPWYRELELAQHGARYIEPELNVCLLPQRGGEALEWWVDFDRTVESFARFSRRDAETLKRWRDEFIPIVENILLPEAQSTPVPPEERVATLQRSREGRRLLEVSQLSPREFAAREFEHPVVQAGLLFFNGLREVDLRASGFGHHIPALLASAGKAQMCVGGSAQLARALVRVIEAAGGEIRTGVTPAKMIVEPDPSSGPGRVTGVRTTAGERIGARQFVASSLNPQQTFLELLEEEVLPHTWRRRARNFRYNLLAPLFGLYLNLDEPPRYGTDSGSAHLDEAFMVIMGLDEAGQFDDMVSAHDAGELPPTVMWGSSPTVFDPTQAPGGKHTAFMWMKVPYRLRGDPANWDAASEEVGDRMLELWCRHAPNVGTARKVDAFVRPPSQTPLLLPNMRDADLLVGSLANGQVGFSRPFPGAGTYRGYLSGLYLCGSSSHPSGNITGLPGRNCAHVILADAGIDAPPRAKTARG